MQVLDPERLVVLCSDKELEALVEGNDRLDPLLLEVVEHRVERERSQEQVLDDFCVPPIVWLHRCPRNVPSQGRIEHYPGESRGCITSPRPCFPQGIPKSRAGGALFRSSRHWRGICTTDWRIPIPCRSFLARRFTVSLHVNIRHPEIPQWLSRNDVFWSKSEYRSSAPAATLRSILSNDTHALETLHSSNTTTSLNYLVREQEPSTRVAYPGRHQRRCMYGERHMCRSISKQRKFPATGQKASFWQCRTFVALATFCTIFFS
mmetsp:Transcript_27859/g.66175  ORF Transcript_27859/g.66175 Transcript_27859/m.66175 type:complete len:263 (+) Transcript_27859:526-1314(+)